MQKTNGRTEIKQTLSANLPRGAYKKIYDELIKNGYPKSLGYIRKVLSIKYDFWNDHIINEAIKICELNMKNLTNINKSISKIKETSNQLGWGELKH